MKTILVDAVYTYVFENGQIFDAMHELLETYPNKKIILTGANDEQYVKYGLDKVTYEVFTLKHNPEKTDPAYYTTMLNHFNLAADDVVYVEHDAEAAKSAESVGITTYIYDQYKQDLTGLKTFLDENTAANHMTYAELRS